MNGDRPSHVLGPYFCAAHIMEYSREDYTLANWMQPWWLVVRGRKLVQHQTHLIRPSFNGQHLLRGYSNTYITRADLVLSDDATNPMLNLSYDVESTL